MELLPAPAAHQDGLFTRSQALAGGLDDEALHAAVRRGRLQVVQRAVYAPAPLQLTPRVQARAAVLTVGHPRAVASHRTAALLHDCGVLALPGPAHVTLPAEIHRRSRRLLTVHRGDLTSSEMVELAGVPITSLQRTLLDVLVSGDRVSAVWGVESSVRRGAVTVPELQARAEIGQDRCRVARIGHRLTRVDARSESPLETAVRLVLHEAGLPPPVLQHPVRTPDGHLLARLDLAYPGLRLGIEADGHGPHDRLSAMYADRWRANALVGWSLLRFTWYDALRRPAYIAGTVRARLEAAA